jgi:hypothetical protein
MNRNSHGSLEEERREGKRGNSRERELSQRGGALAARSPELSIAAATRCDATDDYKSRESGCAARAGRGIRLGFGEWGECRGLQLIYGGSATISGWGPPK